MAVVISGTNNSDKITDDLFIKCKFTVVSYLVLKSVVIYNLEMWYCNCNIYWKFNEM